MKHQPDLDIILLVNSDDIMNVTLKQRSQFKNASTTILFKELLMASMDMHLHVTPDSFPLSVPSVAQNEHVSPFKRISVVF